ncbi:LacI family DNA-binding transcriptional regulator [Shewanella sp.]|uniref:LacI family DNA-binding transcriptional regulator n=1 Tax=Shewanella sp. TaxID=50422 RepID=UPI00356651B7
MQAKQTKRNVTVIDVAKAAGVSKSTVSLVLQGSDKVNPVTREKVQTAMLELGYVYNREAASLRGKRSNLVAIVINDLTNPYSAQLAVGLEANIRRMGLFSMLVNSGEDKDIQSQLVQSLKEYNVAAFVMCPAPGTDADWVDKLAATVPVIHIMREVAGASVPTVLPDNHAGTLASTRHLLAQGYTRIGFFGGNQRISDYGERLAGFNAALAEAGLKPAGIWETAFTNRHGGRLAMAELLASSHRPDALVCFTDIVAYGAIEQLRQQGLKPGEDMAIVGFDDLEDSRLMTPALSSIAIDADAIGAAVCSVLDNIRHGQQVSGLQRLPVVLNVRGSSQKK